MMPALAVQGLAKILVLLAMLCMGIFWHTNRALGQTADTAINPANIDRQLALHNISRLAVGEKLDDADQARNNNFTYKSALVEPRGDEYIIVSDQSGAALTALEKLAQARHGRIVHFDDLRAMPGDINMRLGLFNTLRQAKPKYIVISPRIESFNENVVLAFCQLLANVGNGQINVYPSYLVARDAEGLQHLVDQALSDKPGAPLSALTIAQAAGPNNGGDRAVQKAAFLWDLFKEKNIHLDTMIVRTRRAQPTQPDFLQMANLGTYASSDGSNRLNELPVRTKQAFSRASLITLFGHGQPGETCSIDVGAFAPDLFEGKTVLCGSCFSCYPPFSALPAVSNSTSQCLFSKAASGGARVFYGHMRLNIGFPLLFVAMEALLNGESVGQSYQRVLNTIIAASPNFVIQRNLIMTPEQLTDGKSIGPRNNFLVIMIGDPAARPLSNGN